MDTLREQWNVEAAWILYLLMGVIVTVFGFSLWNRFWKNCRQKRIEIIVSFVTAAIVLFFISPGYLKGENEIMGTIMAVDWLVVLLTIITIKVTGYISIEITDAIQMFVVLLLFSNYFKLQDLANTILLLMSWMCLCSLMKRKNSNIRQMAPEIVISYIVGVISYSVYHWILYGKLLTIYYKISSVYSYHNIQKILFLLGMGMLSLIAVVGIALLLKDILGKMFENISEFSQNYEEIGGYLLKLPYFFSGFLVLFELFSHGELYIQVFLQKSDFAVLEGLFIVVFLLFQLFYMKMLLKTVQLKKHLQYQENQQIQMQLYHEGMDENMQAIREMKHDLKNIFLTMGEYVSRSEDTQLKEYYYEKIAPYAKNEIKINDFYVALEEIQNEPLKAFLYYKLMQAMECHLQVQLDTMLDHSVFPFCTDLTDITRILGIFLDNAMEEVRNLKDGKMDISIKEKEKQVSISIKNTVQEDTLRSGIHSGTTKKGLGRGNGLVIVEKIVKRHSDIIWNSYFVENNFVQMLTICKEV